MHFSNYLRWMEDAEHAFWRSLGLSVHAPDAATPYSWPRVSVSCEYRAPLRFEDEAELRLRLVNLGGRSLTLEVEFLRDGQTVARGTTTAVCCALSPGGKFAAMTIPPEIRERLAPLLAPAG
mgnify:CR=1 FL=1